MSHYLLALDLGTSSTRSALFDSQGQRVMVSTAQEAYSLTTTPEGGAELSPAHLWLAVQNCLQQTLAQLPEGKVVGVGVSCFWHSLLGVDAQGRPLTPIITWADSRNRNQALSLRSELEEKSVHRRTGCMLRTSFWPAKLLWLRETQPKLWKKIHRWLSPAEWIQEQFCGESLCSFSMASGTGLFDPNRLRWDSQLLKRCLVTPAQLNRVSDDSLRLTPAALKAYPRLSEARWLPALGDGAASNLGSGATAQNIAAINFGTSGAVRVMRRGPEAQKASFGLFRYCVDGERRLIGGAISNAGNLRAWALRVFHQEEAKLDHPLEPRHGLTVLPFLAAERAPTWPEEIPACIQGITYNTTDQDLFQAVTEATYHRLAQIIERMETGQGQALTLIISGGISKSERALQHLSNVLGRSLLVSPEPEASLRGAAVFAWEKLGQKIPTLKFGRAIKPHKKAAAAYLLSREKQTRLESSQMAVRRSLKQKSG